MRSKYCNPSSLVTILLVALNAEPKVTFNAFFISSIPSNSTSEKVFIFSNINLLAVTLDSSPIHSTNVLVILASESVNNSLVTGKYPAYLSISLDILSNCGVALAPILPPSPTLTNPVCCDLFLESSLSFIRSNFLTVTKSFKDF